MGKIMYKDYLGKNCDVLKDKKLFLFDMDGTIYCENSLFDGVKELLDVIKRENGKYFVHCEIRESGRIVLDVNVEVDSKIEAENMMLNFRRKPEIVFRGVLAIVSGERIPFISLIL